MVVVATDDDDGKKSSLPEQPAIPGDLDVGVQAGQDRPEQHLVRLEHGSSHPRFQRLDRPDGSEACAADHHGLGIFVEMAEDPLHDRAGLDEPGSFGSSADREETTSNPSPSKYAAPRPLSSSPNHGGWTSATRRTRRARNAAPAASDVPVTGRPHRCERRSSMAASASEPRA